MIFRIFTIAILFIIANIYSLKLVNILGYKMIDRYKEGKKSYGIGLLSLLIRILVIGTGLFILYEIIHNF